MVGQSPPLPTSRRRARGDGRAVSGVGAARDWEFGMRARAGRRHQRTIQAASGQCPPRQRMWGISGKIILGVHITTKTDQHVVTLNRILDMRHMPASENIVHVEGGLSGVTMCFSGPLQAGDLL